MKSFSWVYLIVFTFLSSIVHGQETLTMKQSVQTARANNPILKTLHYNIPLAETDITTAKLRPNPILNNQSLQLVNSNNFRENTGRFNPYNRQVWWQVTKPIRLPSQRRYRIEAAQAGVFLEQQNYF